MDADFNNWLHFVISHDPFLNSDQKLHSNTSNSIPTNEKQLDLFYLEIIQVLKEQKFNAYEAIREAHEGPLLISFNQIKNRAENFLGKFDPVSSVCSRWLRHYNKDVVEIFEFASSIDFGIVSEKVHELSSNIELSHDESVILNSREKSLLPVQSFQQTIFRNALILPGAVSVTTPTKQSQSISSSPISESVLEKLSPTKDLAKIHELNGNSYHKVVQKTSRVFENHLYWNVPTSGCYIKTSNDNVPLTEETKSNRSFLCEAEKFLRELYKGQKVQKGVSDLAVLNATPRHLIIYVAQVKSRMWFDPEYRSLLFGKGSLPSESTCLNQD